MVVTISTLINFKKLQICRGEGTLDHRCGSEVWYDVIAICLFGCLPHQNEKAKLQGCMVKSDVIIRKSIKPKGNEWWMYPVSPSQVGNGESRMGAQVCLPLSTAPCCLPYWPSVFIAWLWYGFILFVQGLKLIQSVSHGSQYPQVGSGWGDIQAQGFIPLLPWRGINECFWPDEHSRKGNWH